MTATLNANKRCRSLNDVDMQINGPIGTCVRAIPVSQKKLFTLLTTMQMTACFTELIEPKLINISKI